MTTENEQLAGPRVARRPHGPSTAPGEPSTAPGEPSTAPGEPSTVPGQRVPAKQGPARQRNPRGQGERLRDDIIDAATRLLAELARLQEAARDGSADLCQQLRAGCLAYCEFGLAHQGQYQVMFASPLPMPADMPPEQFPGLVPFRRLIDGVAACIGAEPTDEQAFFTALLIWQQLHGIVSLRISRPRFPWPPLAETVAEAVDRLLAGARRQ